MEGDGRAYVEIPTPRVEASSKLMSSGIFIWMSPLAVMMFPNAPSSGSTAFPGGYEWLFREVSEIRLTSVGEPADFVSFLEAFSDLRADLFNDSCVVASYLDQLSEFI